MRITGIELKRQITFNQQRKEKHSKTVQSNNHTELNSYPAVYFCGNKDNKKKINIKNERSALLSKIDKYIDGRTPSLSVMNDDERLNHEIEKINKAEKIRKQRIQNIQDTAGLIIISKILGGKKFDEKTADKLLELYNKEMSLRSENYEDMAFSEPDVKEEPDTDDDLNLLFELKHSIQEDKFDLKKVFRAHYEDLTKIETVSEMQERFPSIKVPPRPDITVAGKVEKALSTDFYKELNTKVNTGSDDDVEEHFSSAVKNIIKNGMLKSTPEDRELIYEKIETPLKELVFIKATIMEEKNIYPARKKRNINKGLITEQDKKMLSVDYDKFVLHATREQYLGFKNPNDISYQEGNTTITGKELKNTEYKIEKMPVKIRSLLNDAERVHEAQRDYDNFSGEELLNRLQCTKKYVNSEKYNKICKPFETCRFVDEDMDNLRQLLRITDKCVDGDLTSEEVIKIITEENLSPKGTEKLVRQKNAEAADKEDADNAELDDEIAKIEFVQNKFKNDISLLYTFGLSEAADICNKYMPQSAEKEDLVDSNELTKIINNRKSVVDGHTIIDHPKRLVAEIKCFDKYKEMKKNDPNNPILKKAEKYATDEKGNISTEKAGTYIINTEIINNYPNMTKNILDKDELHIIMNNFKNDTEGAVKCLCKYDEYYALSAENKTKISEIVKIFPREDKREDETLENIINNDYLNVTTSDDTYASNGTKRGTSYILPSAKQELVEVRYGGNSLNAIKKLAEFEKALKIYAPVGVGQGVKNLGYNNDKNKGKYELKIASDDDRLTGYKTKDNKFIFEKFKKDGFHKKKKKSIK